MAFTTNNLSVLAYANGFTLWHYRTLDASIDGPGYFDDAADFLRAGDIILANVHCEEHRRALMAHVADIDRAGVVVDPAA
jgi:hypothetical protein